MARILLGFFIPHWGLPYAQSPISKTFYQLGEFPRELPNVDVPKTGRFFGKSRIHFFLCRLLIT
jgi:hypothetical protein